MKEKLELRLYGLVPYQLIGIQKGIQHGHGAIRYSRSLEKLIEKHPDSENVKEMKSLYNDWADNWETFIILNGGSTNTSVTRPGTLNTALVELKRNGIVLSEMYEPDLGDQLTAVVFIVDERVFNKEDYHEFVDYVYKNGSKDLIREARNSYDKFTYDNFSTSDVMGELELAKAWRDMLGGDKNVFLRGFLKNYRLA